MKKTAFIGLIGLIALYAHAQPTSFHIKNSCSFDDVAPNTEAYLYDPSDEAGRIVSEIVDALGLTKNFLVRASGVRNAVATTEGGQRYILYSTTFLEKFKGDEHTRWAAYAVLAHEIGHHLNGDNFGETDAKRRKIYELEADRFSGSVLRMLGANLMQAQSGVESLEREWETVTHPAKIARREAVATGWKKRDEFLQSRGDGGLPNAPSDKDGDGMPDSRDQCPTEYGTHSSGCPDADADGVLDKVDKCPYQKGLASNDGCPVQAAVDSDNDGVPDNADLCRNQKGEKQFQGCPDTDADGVPDNKDKCPQQKGLATKDGCPEEQKIIPKPTVNAERTITGIVKEAKTGDVLIGASISVVGSTRGTISDVYGKYKMDIPSGFNTIRVSYTGFETAEIPLGASNVVEVSLKEKKRRFFRN